ncbi:hypothetical protein SAMN05216202_1019 [Pseudomonas mucidolens]|uniref:Uncharacterized protein n=1 Tax=Pseudomonas mucidolens TaxID=46679 RepID=A0A1H2M4W8_9PSED|nr:hypothetical protein SAMN05216202_1019 [Pseudomonas mucidolens]SQH34546.1 Uncharacterised protein [Pseudomonas mucidolens]
MRTIATERSELIQHALQSPEQGEINVHAERGHVPSSGILNANRGAFGLPAIFELIGIIGNNLGIGWISNPGKPQLGSRMSDLPARKIVVNGQYCVLGISQIVQYDLTKWAEGLAQAFCNLLKLTDQRLLLGGRFLHREDVQQK